MNHFEISKAISEHGYFRYTVLAGVCPRYTYTIGLTEKYESELIIGGMSLFDFPEIDEIMNNSIDYIKNAGKMKSYKVSIGSNIFRLSNVDSSWIDFATLGAKDYFQSNSIIFSQIVCENRFCIDDAAMSHDIMNPCNHAWKYLVQPWPYEVKGSAEVLLDLGALSGQPISIISRYELDYWEMFSSVDFNYDGDNAKIIPLSVIVERYPHLKFCLSMEIDTKIIL